MSERKQLYNCNILYIHSKILESRLQFVRRIKKKKKFERKWTKEEGLDDLKINVNFPSVSNPIYCCSLKRKTRLFLISLSKKMKNKRIHG